MATLDWQLREPVSAIIFDCDGTLSTIEGVDELAKHNNVLTQVSALTRKAMSESGLNPELYQQRLNLICPHREQVLALGQRYFAKRVQHASDVIHILQKLQKTIYIVSAGLYPAVAIFGELLKVPAKNIFAVNVHFDQQGNFVDHDRHSPLVHNHGKRQIAQQLMDLHTHIVHIGDGLNDFVTQDIVTRFIGFGGIFYRPFLAEYCEYYIHNESLAPLLALTLTQHEYAMLTADEKILYERGLSAMGSQFADAFKVNNSVLISPL